MILREEGGGRREEGGGRREEGGGRREEAGGRRQEGGGRREEGGGRLDLCDIPLLTICKLHKHEICEINNECIINELAWLTVYKCLKLYQAKIGLSITTFSCADDVFIT